MRLLEGSRGPGITASGSRAGGGLSISPQRLSYGLAVVSVVVIPLVMVPGWHRKLAVALLAIVIAFFVAARSDDPKDWQSRYAPWKWGCGLSP